MRSEKGDEGRDGYERAVVVEMRALLVGADYPLPQGPPARRELARLARLASRLDDGVGERARERIARARTRPWREAERGTLRGRVWRERRDEQFVAVDRRERLLSPDDPSDTAAQRESWLAELRLLDPDAAGWEGTIAEVWAWRQEAATRQAAALLAREEVRAALAAISDVDQASPSAVVRAVVAALGGLVEEGKLARLPLPVVGAALVVASIER